MKKIIILLIIALALHHIPVSLALGIAFGVAYNIMFSFTGWRVFFSIGITGS